MRVLLFTLSLFLLCLFPLGVFAQEEVVTNETESSTTTTNFFTDIYEELVIFFTFNEERKLERRLEFAEKRLSMIEELPDSVSAEVRERLQERYEKHMQKALEIAERRQEKIEERVQKIIQTRERHMLVLEEVYERVPEEAKEGINNAIENTLRQYERDRNRVGDDNLEVEGSSIPLDKDEKIRLIKERIENRREGRGE
jgi:cation transport regulator ChaB